MKKYSTVIVSFYRVTHQVVPNLSLTLIWKLCCSVRVLYYNATFKYMSTGDLVLPDVSPCIKLNLASAQTRLGGRVPSTWPETQRTGRFNHGGSDGLTEISPWRTRGRNFFPAELTPPLHRHIDAQQSYISSFSKTPWVANTKTDRQSR